MSYFCFVFFENKVNIFRSQSAFDTRLNLDKEISVHFLGNSLFWDSVLSIEKNCIIIFTLHSGYCAPNSILLPDFSG